MALLRPQYVAAPDSQAMRKHTMISTSLRRDVGAFKMYRCVRLRSPACRAMPVCVALGCVSLTVPATARLLVPPPRMQREPQDGMGR